MQIAIQPDDYADGASSPRWAALLAERGCEVRWVDVYRRDIVSQLAGCDGFMWRFGQLHGMWQIARRLLPVLERELGMVVYPSQNACWYFDDKITQIYLYDALQIPMPRTWVWFDHERARAWAADAEYPLVFKLWEGAGSENVRLVSSARDALAWIDLMFADGAYHLPATPRRRASLVQRSKAAVKAFLKGTLHSAPRSRWELHKNYALFQEFLPDNPYDTRVTVLGRRAFGFRRWNRDDDFRASGSGKLDWDPNGVDPRLVRLAFETAYKLGAESCAIDFLWDRAGNPVIAEVCYTYASWAIRDCPGHWVLRGDEPALSPISWQDGQMWPEEAQVADFITAIETRRLATQMPNALADLVRTVSDATRTTATTQGSLTVG